MNPHALRRHPLKMVCLPIPPLPQASESERRLELITNAICCCDPVLLAGRRSRRCWIYRYRNRLSRSRGAGVRPLWRLARQSGRQRRSRRRGLDRFIAQDGSAAVSAIRNNREGHRRHHEYRCQNCRRLREKITRPARAECRLAAHAPKRSRQIPAFCALQQDHENQDQSNQDMNRR